jgi:hypothetical protein
MGSRRKLLPISMSMTHRWVFVWTTPSWMQFDPVWSQIAAIKKFILRSMSYYNVPIEVDASRKFVADGLPCAGNGYLILFYALPVAIFTPFEAWYS